MSHYIMLVVDPSLNKTVLGTVYHIDSRLESTVSFCFAALVMSITVTGVFQS